MTVKELIAVLQNCNPDYEVVIDGGTIQKVLNITDAIKPENSRVDIWVE